MMILKYDRSPQANRRKGGMPTGRFIWPLLFTMLVMPLFLSAEMLTYTVKKGDNLYRIGVNNGVTVQQLMELNGLETIDISVGQVLKIKEVSPAPPPQVIAPATPITPPPKVEDQPALTPPTEPTAEPQSLPEDYYYTVKPKDNLYRISINNKIKLNDLLRWNGFESDSHPIQPNDRLIVKDPAAIGMAGLIPDAINPAQPGTSATPDTVVIEKIYVVQKKDTLYRIAKDNGMTVDELKALNNLTSNEIKEGMKLWLAGNPPAGTDTGLSRILTEAEIQKSDKIRSDCIMPTRGSITSEFGLRRGRPHKGIDIANKSGTPVYAALDGVVVFSGVQSGYGNVIVIEHPDFVMTVYAHNEKNLVRVDDRVKQGQLIAYMGATGNSSGPHLHFEYRIKGKAINPRKVLPL
jgi:murein DD-endopeptidase MepM/ murein hydrolase activator NlpD